MHEPTEFTSEQIHAGLKELPPVWYSPLDLGFGINTGSERTQRRFERRLKLLQIPADLTGLRVLDIATWDGFFAFEMEKRGAEVTAIDMWDDGQFSGAFQQFDFARRVKRSKIHFERLDAHDISAERLGTFDLVFCAGLLYHLRNPLLALEAIRTVCRGQLILETVGMIPFLHRSFPMITFFPGDAKAIESGRDWGISGAATTAWLVEALAAAGFSHSEVIYEPSFILWKRFLALVKNRPQGGRVILHAFASTR